MHTDLLRARRLDVDLNEGEFSHCQRLAAACELPLRRWARRTLLGVTIAPAQPAELRALWSASSTLQSNLNQAAARLTAPRVDWFRVFTDLDRVGYKLPMVAATLSMSYSTLVSRRNDGSEPRHADGEQILTLWCSVLSKPREAIPRLWDESLSAAKAKT